MHTIPAAVRQQFTAVLAGRQPLAEFEQWVYTTPELETALPTDDYLEVVSFNYKQRDALRLLHPLLKRFVRRGEVQREELLGYLRDVQARSNPDAVINALGALYDWYCQGCLFLREVALSAGIEVYCYLPTDDSWQRQADAQKWEYCQHFYPAAQHAAERIIDWLNTGQIQFEPDPDSNWYFNYVDNRPTSERT